MSENNKIDELERRVARLEHDSYQGRVSNLQEGVTYNGCSPSAEVPSKDKAEQANTRIEQIIRKLREVANNYLCAAGKVIPRSSLPSTYRQGMRLFRDPKGELMRVYARGEIDDREYYQRSHQLDKEAEERGSQFIEVTEQETSTQK